MPVKRTDSITVLNTDSLQVIMWNEGCCVGFIPTDQITFNKTSTWNMWKAPIQMFNDGDTSKGKNRKQIKLQNHIITLIYIILMCYSSIKRKNISACQQICINIQTYPSPSSVNETLFRNYSVFISEMILYECPSRRSFLWKEKKEMVHIIFYMHKC